MALWLLPAAVFAALVAVAAMTSRRFRGHDDGEFTRAAAMLDPSKRRRAETRAEAARECTVAILGEEGRTDCRMLNFSRSGMRIAAGRQFSPGAQLIVEWENGFFVGTVRHGSTSNREYVFGLQLVSTNCRG